MLILVPTPLVSQWHEELQSKFALEFSIPPRTATADRPEYWANTDLVLASLPFAKSKRRADAVTAADWGVKQAVAVLVKVKDAADQDAEGHHVQRHDPDGQTRQAANGTSGLPPG